jgi:hypothetical protein
MDQQDAPDAPALPADSPEAVASEPDAGGGKSLLDGSLHPVEDNDRQHGEYDRNEAGHYKGLHRGSLACRDRVMDVIPLAMPPLEAWRR